MILGSGPAGNDLSAAPRARADLDRHPVEESFFKCVTANQERQNCEDWKEQFQHQMVRIRQDVFDRSKHERIGRMEYYCTIISLTVAASDRV
jgi:hypothetical protein